MAHSAPPLNEEFLYINVYSQNFVIFLIGADVKLYILIIHFGQLAVKHHMVIN